MHNNCFLSQRYSVILLYNIGAKYFLYPSPFYHNKQKYEKYEITIPYFVIFYRFYESFNKNDIPML